MQLSFSIDFILGTAGSKQKTESSSKSEHSNHVMNTPEKKSSQGPISCSTPIKEEIQSPRSFTIEWKPASCEKSPESHKDDLRHRVTQERRNLCESRRDRSRIFHSPPNARVVTNMDAHSLEAQNISQARLEEREHLVTRMNNLKALQKRLSASRFLPYPTETLQHHRVQHHPHHYPYHLPFLHPAQSIPAISAPGIFSPHFSYPQRHDIPAPTTCHSYARMASPDSSVKSVSPNPFQTRKTVSDASAASSSESEMEQRNSPKSFQGSPAHSDKTSSPHVSPRIEEPQGKQCEKSENSEGQESTEEENVQTQEKKSGKSSKRVGRRLFTGFQILELEKAFAVKPYLNRMERAFISQKVNLTECQIKTWFQNRRTKEKRRGNGSDEDEMMAKTMGCSIARYSSKPLRVPGYGIQNAPSFGLPDQHLQAAIVDYLRRRSSGEIIVSAH